MALFTPGTVVAVATSAVEVYTPTSAGTAVNPTVINTGSNTIYLGQSGVTSSTGLKVAPGAQVTLSGTEEAIYAICASGHTPSTTLAGLATVDAVV
jgi:hypothetical protein